eukprot:gene20034-23978_t
MGCFWGPELRYQRVPGVVTTETGYTNGGAESVTYEEVCSGRTGFAEVVQMRYDPSEVTFSDLLEVFWQGHDPTTLNQQGGDRGTQYRSGIFTHSDAQLEEAQLSMELKQLEFGGNITTEIAPVENYCPAESYHQQYLAK